MTDSKRISLSTLATIVLSAPSLFARSGGVDYSWGADALASAHDFLVTMMLYVQYLCYAFAGIMVIISALQIYIKMQTGEGEIIKHITMLFGAVLFSIGASIVFPAFFGYRI